MGTSGCEPTAVHVAGNTTATLRWGDHGTPAIRTTATGATVVAFTLVAVFLKRPTRICRNADLFTPLFTPARFLRFVLASENYRSHCAVGTSVRNFRRRLSTKPPKVDMCSALVNVG